jgi:hypothetical protein
VRHSDRLSEIGVRVSERRGYVNGWSDMSLEFSADSPLAVRYLQRWRGEGGDDCLERFLAECGEVSLADLVGLLSFDQRLCWRHRPGPTVEQYLERFPALADQPDAVFELLYGELRAARTLGLPIVVDEYAARFPHSAERLRRQMSVAAWFDELEEDEGPFGTPCW